MLPSLRPSQGAGLPTLSYPAKYADGIGDVTYALSLPSQNYLPADGRSIKAASYPSYALKFATSKGYHSQKLTDAAGGPVVDVSLFESAISQDAAYAAAANSTTGTSIVVFKLSDTASIQLTGLTMNSGSNPTGPEGMSFAPNGDYLVAGCDVAPYVCAWRRTPGTDTFGPSQLTTGASPGSAPACIEVTDDYVAVVSAGSSTGYVNCYQLSSTAWAKVGAATFPGSLTAAPLQIVRNKAGTRYAMRFAAAPHVRVFDYSGAGIFVDTGYSLTLNTSPARISMSAAGDFIAISDGASSNSVLIYKASGANSYAIYKILPQSGGSRWQTNFSPDDVELFTGNAYSNLIVYKPSNGVFSELARGNVGGYVGSNAFFQMRFSLNGKIMMQLIGVSPFVTFYTRGPSIVDIELPGYPVINSNSTKLIPYVKVK